MIVEAAITMLLLFIFLFGLIEVSRFISVQQALTDAAREGARIATQPLSQTTTLADPYDVRTQVCTFLNAASVKCLPDNDDCSQAGACIKINDPAPDATVCPPTGAPASCTKVHVEVPYEVMTLAMFGNFSITLKAEALMRNETSP